MVGGKDFSREAFSFQRCVFALGGKVLATDGPLGGGVAKYNVCYKAWLQETTRFGSLVKSMVKGNWVLF